MFYVVKEKKEVHLHVSVTREQNYMEMPGIEPGAFHMQSERSTTEPHPQI